jgi:hypothetical protein
MTEDFDMNIKKSNWIVIFSAYRHKAFMHLTAIPIVEPNKYSIKLRQVKRIDLRINQ